MTQLGSVNNSTLYVTVQLRAFRRTSVRTRRQCPEKIRNGTQISYLLYLYLFVASLGWASLVKITVREVLTKE